MPFTLPSRPHSVFFSSTSDTPDPRVQFSLLPLLIRGLEPPPECLPRAGCALQAPPFCRDRLTNWALTIYPPRLSCLIIAVFKQMTPFSYICSKFVSQKLENLVTQIDMAGPARPWSVELIGYSTQNKEFQSLLPEIEDTKIDIQY